MVKDSSFETLFNDLEHYTVARAVFENGDIYNIENMYDAKLDYAVLPNNLPGVGGANVKQLTLGILPKSEITRGAKVKIEVAVEKEVADAASRINGWTYDGERKIVRSSWVAKGTFYVDTRESLDDGLRTSFHCYDAMLKGDTQYVGDKGCTALASWPQTDRAVVADIAAILGVTVDPDNSLGGYTIQRPLDDMTVREVLGYIGAMNGGNFIVSERERLKLIKIVPDRALLSTETHIPVFFGNTFIVLHTPGAGGNSESNVERLVRTFTDLGVEQPYTGVRGRIDDNNSYFAGDETGNVLEFNCPWVTQTAVNSILDEIKGYVYHPYEATEAELTPLAEMGDVVGVNGVFAPLYSFFCTIDGGYYPDIGAPSAGEQDYEYPYESKTEREARRNANEAKQEAKHAVTVAEQIANGTYNGGTFIDGTSIFAPNIYGGATLHIGARQDGGYNFVVDSSGNVTSYGSAAFDGSLSLGGNITLANSGSLDLSHGSITWASDTSPAKIEYSDTGLDGSWHSSYISTDEYVRFSYDGGNTWTVKERIQEGDVMDGVISTVPKYIKNTSIDMTSVSSPFIYGGLFYATGAGVDTGRGNYEQAAYYLTNGIDASGAPNRPLGWLSFDSQGNGADENTERIFLHTEGTVAIKLEAGGNMSLSAGARNGGLPLSNSKGHIFMQSAICLKENVLFGDQTAFNSVKSAFPQRGQVFFLIE